DDGSVQHRIHFNDSGTITGAETSQGYGSRSTWARGQAWILHSLASCCEAFDDERIQAALRLAVTWYLDHLPEDHVLYYDFDDPDVERAPRDSCGTLISAVALRRSVALGLASYEALAAAQASEDELLRGYVAQGGLVLHGSWGVGDGKSRW